MKYTYSDIIPLHIQVWLATDTYLKSEDPKEISATGLLKPTKSIILSERVQQQRTTAITNGEFSLLDQLNKPDLQGFVKSRIGTSIHDSVENAWKTNYKQALSDLGYGEDFIHRINLNPQSFSEINPDDIVVYTEKRLKRKIGEHTISGELDFVFNKVIQDLKSTSTYAFKYTDDAKHTMQMSIYHWIFSGNGIDLDTQAQVNYLFTDWSPITAARDPNYPPANAVGVQVQLLPHSEVESFIANKIQMVEEGRNLAETDLIQCTPEELWQSESSWAYYGNVDKLDGRATKKFDNYQEAVKHKNEKGKGVIIERPGLIKFCNYCNGASLCTQKDTYIAAGLLEMK